LAGPAWQSASKGRFNRLAPAEKFIDHLEQLTGVQLDFSKAMSAPIAAACCTRLVMVM